MGPSHRDWDPGVVDSLTGAQPRGGAGGGGQPAMLLFPGLLASPCPLLFPSDSFFLANP